MKKRIAWLVALAGAVVIGSLAITSPLVQNLLYTGRRTGGSDRAQGTYELQGEDLTLKEPVFGGAQKDPRTLLLTGRIRQDGGEVAVQLSAGKESTPLCSYAGYFQQEVVLPAGSAYIEVVCHDFTGYIMLENRDTGHQAG